MEHSFYPGRSLPARLAGGETDPPYTSFTALGFFGMTKPTLAPNSSQLIPSTQQNTEMCTEASLCRAKHLSCPCHFWETSPSVSQERFFDEVRCCPSLQSSRSRQPARLSTACVSPGTVLMRTGIPAKCQPHPFHSKVHISLQIMGGSRPGATLLFCTAGAHQAEQWQLSRREWFLFIFQFWLERGQI